MFCVVLAGSLLAIGCGGASVPWTRHQKNSGSLRIINGSPATEGEFPSQLSLQMNGQHFCGASILSDRWALTAAHCAQAYPTKFLTLLSGTNDLNGKGTVHPVSQCVIHREFTDAFEGKDIAVLEVSIPFDLDGIVRKPITLPEINQPTDSGATATVIGWGYTSLSLERTNLLQKVDIQIMDNKACDKEISNLTIHPNQLCAYSLEVKGPCGGDSGGPLFVNGVVVGIVSYGTEVCSTSEEPAVFTRVASFVEWIEEITGV